MIFRWDFSLVFWTHFLRKEGGKNNNNPQFISDEQMGVSQPLSTLQGSGLDNFVAQVDSKFSSSGRPPFAEEICLFASQRDS